MGTDLVVLAPASAAAAGPTVRDVFADWEQRFSRFQPDSELSRVNGAAGQTVQVSPLFAEVTQVALAAAAATDGLFDPTLERRLVALGYDRTFAELPGDRPTGAAEVAATAGSSGAWRLVELDAEAGTVRLPPGVGLDFGGLAKGMAVDAALAALVASGADGVAVNAGGDLAVQGKPPGAEAWSIVLDEVPGRPVIGLAEGALASSSIDRRRWRADGAERHHLLDPRTGRPAASGIRAVTVAAPDCRRAEVACKAALLLGPTAGPAFLERHRLAGLLVTDGGEVITVGRRPGIVSDSGPGAASGRDAVADRPDGTPVIAGATETGP